MTTARHDLPPEPRGWSRFDPRAVVRAALLRLTSTIRDIARHATLGATPTVGMVRMITLLAGLAAFAISAALPVSWFLAARSGLRAEIESRARIFAFQAEREAGQNPAFWNALAGNPTHEGFQNLDLARPPDPSGTDAGERRRVFSGGGWPLIDVGPTDKAAEERAAGPRDSADASTARTVAEDARSNGPTDKAAADQPPDGLGAPKQTIDGPAWPLLTAALPVMDGTTTLGRVEIARSLRPALLETAVVATASGCLGILMFMCLRVAPLRMLHKAIEHASFMSAHDLLTGLPNRRLFQDRLEQALAGARRDGGRIAVFYLDLDHFKDINDLLGHPAGDTTLRIVAARLHACLRDTDTLARLGGDEFAIIQPTLRRVEEAAVLGSRLIDAIAPPLELGGEVRAIGLSVGIAVAEPGAENLAELLMKQADMALYRAKQEGRGRICFYTPDMDVRLRERHAMQTDLRLAIAQHALTLHYQPQIDLATGAVVGAEALLRWNRPGHGMTGPDRFIPLAEDTGLIVPIGLWVLREACLRAATWPNHIGVAVNVSPVQFRRPDFCQAVIDTIAEAGIAPERVELEITEGVLLRDTDETLETLRRLREFGTLLAMDDFGTGYSSLAYLSRFNFDKIKIDRGFTSRLGADAEATAIVRAVLGLTKALGVKTNAEGVETHAQVELLRAQGCSEAQGYLFSRPLPGDAFHTLVWREALAVPMPFHTDLMATPRHAVTA